MKCAAEVSVYPLKTNDASGVINSCINTLGRQGLKYDVGSISTFIKGSADEVWTGLRAVFDEAQRSGEVNMVITITNAAG